MKKRLLIIILFLITLSCVCLIYWHFNGDKTFPPVTSAIMSESKAIEIIKNQFPELKEYPSDKLAPKSIKTEKAPDGWYVAFIQEGSGRPIILAKCYFIDNSEKITNTGVWSPKYSEYGVDDISLKNCQPKELNPKPGGEIPPIPKEKPVACTMDAKQCPDGSYVGRSGPNCEFVCPQ